MTSSHHGWDYVAPTVGAILPCKLFLKRKYSASGEFLKLKAQLVAEGHLRPDPTIQEKSIIVGNIAMALSIIDYAD